jgi:hypothetical protein
MKSSHVASSILFGMFVVLLPGCKAKEAASNTAAKPAPAASSIPSPAGNSNQPVQTASSNRNANAPREADTSEKGKATSSPELVGTYESREVQKEGVVTLISGLKTTFVFSSDGRYSRVSEVKGKIYHNDSGQFRIDPPDKLVLSIQMTGQKAQRKVQTPAVEKTHKFSVSPDGDELKLTSDKGSIGIFRRVAKPKPS